MKKLANIAGMKADDPNLASALRVIDQEFTNIYKHVGATSRAAATTVIRENTVVTTDSSGSGVSSAQLTALQNQLAQLATSLGILTTQVGQLPVYWPIDVDPSTLPDFGKDGDTARDRVGRMDYKKVEGVWIQQGR